MPMSSTAIAGLRSRARARARSPLDADTTSKPSRRRRVVTSNRMSSSSSATRTSCSLMPAPAPAKPVPPLLVSLRGAYGSCHELRIGCRALDARWQLDAEGHPAAVAARDSDRPVVRLDDRARDEQAEACAWHLLCDDARGAEEAVEYELGFPGAEPDAGVAHLEQRALSVTRGERHRHRARPRGSQARIRPL